MIIGDGFIARSFKIYDNKYDIIYASGVPNIFGYSEDGCKREKKKLRSIILNNRCFRLVYFSSCGIYDKNNLNNYFYHKLKMEKFIKDISDNYIIFRLPIVVGKGSNNNSLCQYLFNCIVKGKSFDLWNDAYRYLIDIDDVFEIIKFVLDNNYFNNEIVNISSSKKIKVLDIVSMLESFLNKKSNYRLCNKVSCYDINIDKLKRVVTESVIYKKRYAECVLEKYYKS